MSKKGLLDVIDEMLNEGINDHINKITQDNIKDGKNFGGDFRADDTQGVLGSTSGSAMDAGGDKDVGHTGHGKHPSAASPDTQGVLGSTSGSAMDAGGDTDVGGSKGDNASDASSDTQGVLGKTSGSALDAGGDKDVGKMRKEDTDEEEMYYNEETDEWFTAEELDALVEEGYDVELIEDEELSEDEDWVFVDEETGEELDEEQIEELANYLLDEEELSEAAMSKQSMTKALAKDAQRTDKNKSISLSGPGGKKVTATRQKAIDGGRYKANDGMSTAGKGSGPRTAWKDKRKKTSDRDIETSDKLHTRKDPVKSDDKPKAVDKEMPRAIPHPKNVKISKSANEPTGSGPRKSSDFGGTKSQKSAAAGSSVKVQKIPAGKAAEYGSVQNKNKAIRIKEELEDQDLYYVAEWDEFFTEEDLLGLQEQGYEFELDEASVEKTAKPTENTSADTQGVLGKKKGAAMDAGGDKDVGKLKESEDDEDELEEKLHGDQHKLDHNKNNKIDAQDMKMVRKVGPVKEEDELEEAEGEALKKVNSSSNEEQRPPQEKGDNMPKDHKAGDPMGSTKGAAMDGGGDKDVGKLKEEVEIEEDFKARAEVIFEAAVGEKVNIIREKLEEQYEEALAEEKAALNETAASYIEEAVAEWLQENTLEIKYSLRTEIAENFIKGLKGLFEESYIEIPEEDYSAVDELTEAVEEQKEQIDALTEELKAAKAFILESKRKEVVAELSEDLTQTQAVRLEKLAEGLEAEDINEFKEKVNQLKEGYFDPSNEQPLMSLTEEVFTGTDEMILEDNTSVSQYAKFLSKTVLK